MAQNATILTLFVSSPADVAAERNLVSEVVDELNRSVCKKHGVRLEVWRWETDAHPAAGADPQAILNAQIPSDYDVFVGIMWNRFGTPTERSGSGTEEELTEAKKRIMDDKCPPAIMFYFKTTAVAAYELDIDQLQKVQQLRKKCSTDKPAVLFADFASEAEFEKLLRLHLIRYLEEYSKRVSKSEQLPHAVIEAAAKEPSSGGPPEEEGEIDELPGLIDLVVESEEQIAGLQPTLARITERTLELGAEFEKASVEMALAVGEPETNFKKVKRICSAVAGALDSYSSNLSSDVDNFRRYANGFLETVLRALELAEVGDEDDAKALEELLSPVDQLSSAIQESRKGIASFRVSIQNTPRATSELNRARRRAANVLDELLGVLDQADRLSAQVADVVRVKLSGSAA